MKATVTSLAENTVCASCDGSGWQILKIEGKADRATRCECRKGESRAVRMLAAAAIPQKYRECSLADYDTRFPGANPSLAAGKMAAEHLIASYPVEKSGLLFVGSLGIGKTHLACAVLCELIRTKGASGVFYSYADLLTEIRSTYSESGSLRTWRDVEGQTHTVQESESQILARITTSDILLLDEIGKVKASDWVLDKIREIIGRRYNAEKTTLFTTNFPLTANPGRQEISLGEKIGADMVSRLIEMCKVVEMHGADFRQRVRRA